ncbi:hypothetical protein [Pseudoalteromonas sp.]|uniref:hypothetical protein n=1 Tax=Pseudoalteromonas sp. TaxID=53249 RepID=UPI003D0BB28D
MSGEITQEYIECLVYEKEKSQKRVISLLLENESLKLDIEELKQANMLLRQQLEQKDERVFVSSSCRSRNNHVDDYKTADDIRMDIIARNGNDGDHYE